MADFGVSFVPTDQGGQNQTKPPLEPLQQAIQLLSLRLPRVVGAQAIAPGPLLQSPGMGGLAQVLQQIFGQRGAGPISPGTGMLYPQPVGNGHLRGQFPGYDPGAPAPPPQNLPSLPPHVTIGETPGLENDYGPMTPPPGQRQLPRKPAPNVYGPVLPSSPTPDASIGTLADWMSGGRSYNF